MRIKEVYLSVFHPGTMSGWKRSSLRSQNLTVLIGEVSFALLDARQEPYLVNVSANSPSLLQIPKDTWYAIFNRSEVAATILNMIDEFYKEEKWTLSPKISVQEAFNVK